MKISENHSCCLVWNSLPFYIVKPINLFVLSFCLFLYCGVLFSRPLEVYDASLFGLYHFDESEGSTTYLDSSFSGNNGSCSGGTCPTNSVLGKFNSAASFDGNDEIGIPDNSNQQGMTQLTISMWTFPTTLDGNPRGLVSKRISSASTRYFTYFVWTGNRTYFDVASTRVSNIATVLSTNRWYHITLIYDGGPNTVNVYFNGTLDANSPQTQSQNSIPSNLNPGSEPDLMIAAMNAGYAQDYVGIIDEVALYDTALDDDAVMDLYQRGRWRHANQMQICGGTFCDISSLASKWFAFAYRGLFPFLA